MNSIEITGLPSGSAIYGGLYGDFYIVLANGSVIDVTWEDGGFFLSAYREYQGDGTFGVGFTVQTPEEVITHVRILAWACLLATNSGGYPLNRVSARS